MNTPARAAGTDSRAAESNPLPYSFAKRHGVIVVSSDGHRASIRHRPGVSHRALVEVRRRLGVPIEIGTATPAEFDRLLARIYQQSDDAASAAVENLEGIDLDEMVQQLAAPEDLLEAAESAPVVRLVNALLAEAIRKNASDIHLEPYEQRLVVRLRVDGVLREALQLDRAIANLLSSRVKVMAKLDIAEKRLPQDGRISVQIAGHGVDLRVSTIPSAYGERVVMRLLDKQAGHLDLEQLGMPENLRVAIDALINRSHGILLVTGPTGSGKTTSLYAMLTRLNDHSRNIMTVEDPIEYHIDGIAQTQVNPRIELNFARGLRAILRQDPDVVMVGEIRDLETAQIAVQASLTGHLVLSTLHTNSAAGAVTRLRDMGIEPYLLSSSLLGVLAQRLVRRLCPQCKTPDQPNAQVLARLGITPVSGATLFKPAGCAACADTGYRGRTGIFELLQVDEELRTLIHDGAGDHDLRASLRRQGNTLFEDGRRRILSGETSIAELLRVSQQDTSVAH